MGKEEFKIDISDDRIEMLGLALSAQIRRKILMLLNTSSYSIIEIASILNIPVSTAAFHIKILKQVNLVLVTQKQASKGNTKIVSLNVDKITLNFLNVKTETTEITSHIVNIPVGSYCDAKVSPTCGLASEKSLLTVDDFPSAFFDANRFKAQLVWFSKGFLEYRIPNYFIKDKDLINMNISLELCSEAPNYQNDWKSDITFWVNGVELCTYQSDGDYGIRRGRLNPAWWPDYSTQYGKLVNIMVDSSNTYLNERGVSGVKLKNLLLAEGEYITLRIGNKADAKNSGGVNIFGEKFGDYEQNILVKFDYKNKEE